MYKVPESFDISVLKNKVVSQICFGMNFITLFFDIGFIQFSGSFSFSYRGEELNFSEVYPIKNDLGLLQLIEKEITNVKLSNNREELKLEFDEGASLCLIGNEMYESFVISIDGHEIKV